jgi:hypothetical protein
MTAHDEDFSSSQLVEGGLMPREVEEFFGKLKELSKVPDFELDLSRAKPGSYFEEMMAAAAPKEVAK